MEIHDQLIRSIRNDFADACLQGGGVHGDAAFLQLVKRHRLLPLLFGCLPDGIPDALRDARDRLIIKGIQARRVTHETLSAIAARAQAADTRFVVIKGLALEHCVYGAQALRDTGDIDVLVLSEDVASMHDILIGMGYRQRKGPTSAGHTAQMGHRAYLAAHAQQISDTFPATQMPVRRHREKPHYAPYARQGSPTVELHDGFYHFAAEDLRSVFRNGFIIESNTGFPVFDARVTFLILIANTFENSESFFSNSYDFKAVLRDYVDLYHFFKRYEENPLWEDAAGMVGQFGLTDKAGVVLGNLYEVYGRDVTRGALPGLCPKRSGWGVGILDRMRDPGLARNASLSAFRRALQKAAHPAPLIARPEDGAFGFDPSARIGEYPQVCYGIAYHPDALILLWSFPRAFLNGENRLLQFRFYPLADGSPHTAYKIDCYFYENRYHALGHETYHFYSSAIHKATGRGLAVFECGHGTRHLIRVALPFTELGLARLPDDDSFCVSAGVFEQHCEHIYHNISTDRNRILADEVELGLVFSLRFERG
jgi:hypothetical protein